MLVIEYVGGDVVGDVEVVCCFGVGDVFVFCCGMCCGVCVEQEIDWLVIDLYYDVWEIQGWFFCFMLKIQWCVVCGGCRCLVIVFGDEVVCGIVECLYVGVEVVCVELVVFFGFFVWYFVDYY